VNECALQYQGRGACLDDCFIGERRACDDKPTSEINGTSDARRIGEKLWRAKSKSIPLAVAFAVAAVLQTC